MLATFGCVHGAGRRLSEVSRDSRAGRGGGRPAARNCAANRGHGLHLFEQQLESGRSGVARGPQQRSRRSAPGKCGRPFSTSRWTGSDDAAAMLERCEAKDPLVPTLPAMALLLRVWRRDFDAGDRLRGSRQSSCIPICKSCRVNYRPGARILGTPAGSAGAVPSSASVMSPDLPWLRALEGTLPREMEPGR